MPSWLDIGSQNVHYAKGENTIPAPSRVFNELVQLPG